MQLNYSDEGKATQKSIPILLIHGFGQSLEVWDAFASEICGRYRVLRADQLGHGESDKSAPDFSIPAQARAISGLLTGLKIPKVHIIAHSGGGDVAVAVAELSPPTVTSITFLGTTPAVRYVRMGMAAKLMRLPLLGQILWGLATDEMISKGMRKTFAPGFPRVPEIYVSAFRKMTFESYIAGISGLEAYKNERDLCRRLSGYTIPLYLIFGDRDQWIHADAVRHWRNSTRVKIDLLSGVGHTPMAEAPEATARLALKFLETQTFA